MAVRVFDWDEQLAVGKRGENRVVQHLLATGHEVRDLSDDKRWRKRDVDLLVDEWMVEVKSDTHSPRNIFAETSECGGPGYLYKTRADFLLTWYTRHGLLVWVPVPALLWWVGEHGPTLQRRTIQSRRRGGRIWTAEGLLVPLDALRRAGFVREEAL